MAKVDVHGIAERFGVILKELSNRERVNINELVEITGYGKRNLQMDLNGRLKDPFRIETDHRGNYWMDKKYQGLFTADDIKKFSDILGISNIFPYLDTNFLTSMIEDTMNRAVIFKSPYKESIKGNEQFDVIVKAINRNHKIRLSYKKGTDVKRHSVEPYRLVNSYGSWYLFAMEGEILKSFRFSRITAADENMGTFTINPDVLEKIESSDTLWISTDEAIEIKLLIDPGFAAYFTENLTIPGQVDVETQRDGSLIVNIKAYYTEEVKNIIKYWIPRIKVLEPEQLKEEIDIELKEYLKLL